MFLREWKRCVSTQKTHWSYKKHIFVMEKYIEDARQDEKHFPDLLEAIMRSTCLVKEELRPILFKTCQFKSKITKIQVWVRLTQKLKVPKWVCQSPLANFRSGPPFLQYLAPLGAKYMERLRQNIKMRVLAPLGLVTLVVQAKLSSRDQVGC